MLVKGNVDCVFGVKNVLELFYSFFGLSVNVEKTEFFCLGVLDVKVQAIIEESRFRLGRLPVRYLGVPLVDEKLPLTDCEALLKKLRDKMKIRYSKLLTYTSRLQLISLVLFSIHVYWSRHFIFPKKVIQAIVQICSALWKGKLQKKKKSYWCKLGLPDYRLINLGV